MSASRLSEPLGDAMNYILQRLKEPSTRIALAGILYAIAPAFPAYTAIAQGIAALLAGHAVVAPDPQK